MSLLIEKNQYSKKTPHALMWMGDGTDKNPTMCIGKFSNIKKMLAFLQWYQIHFGYFTNAHEASSRLANAASQADINYIPMN